MPEASQEKDQGSDEPVIEVDLGEPDPTKAVSRSERQPRVADQVRADKEVDEEDARVKQWAEKNKAVQKRIARVERSFETRLAEQEARHQREMTALREDVERRSSVRDERGSGPDDSAHQREMDDLQRQLEAAIEKGDSATQARITRQMYSKEAEHSAKKAREAGVDARTRSDARTDTRQTDRQPVSTTTSTDSKKGPTAAGGRFIKANDWWDDEDFKAERTVANVLFQELKEDGYDPDDDEMYAEIAKRLNRKFPSLKAAAGKKGRRVVEDDGDELVEREAPVIRHQDRGGNGNESRANRRTITAEEIATMRASGLDPNNNRHVVQFLREAQNIEGLR